MKDEMLMLQCQETATEEELKEMGMRQRFRKNQRNLHINHTIDTGYNASCVPPEY